MMHELPIFAVSAMQSLKDRICQPFLRQEQAESHHEALLLARVRLETFLAEMGRSFDGWYVVRWDDTAKQWVDPVFYDKLGALVPQ